MAEDWGNGVSRTLSALERQFAGVVIQKNKPPIDSEHNLMGQIDSEKMRQIVKEAMPSGWIIDPTRAADDFLFDASWSNRFVLGNQRASETQPPLWTNVNGWVIPVAGTRITTTSDTSNIVELYPPPSTQARIDLVFIEVWQTLVAPNPATANKPSASTIWKHGNVEYGGTNITDDIEDPAIGMETSERVQTQYRIRVFGSGVGAGLGVALDRYPDGLGDPSVKGQGTAIAPLTDAVYAYSNMRETLNDPSLWRCGDGNPNNSLGTIDGYSYAIPICAVFRRNTDTFVASTLAGNPNQNGAFNRNPSAIALADPRDGATIFVTPTLGTALPLFNPTVPHGDLGITITNFNGSVLAQGGYLNLANTFMVIENEIVGIKSINTNTGTIVVGNSERGRFGTDPTSHVVGATIGFYNNRPDGYFADQVAWHDVLDLRRTVTYGDWDYNRLLYHNLLALTQNKLRTAYKDTLGDSQGVSILEVDYAYTGGAVPNHCESVDGFDGIRTIFSDAAVIQPEVTMLLDNDATLDANKFTSATFDQLVAWDVGPDFLPTGFMNNTDAGDWGNGTSIFVHIGGLTGEQGARRTFKNPVTGDDVKAVRFLTPYEYWKTIDPGYGMGEGGNQYPVKLTFLGHSPHEPRLLFEEVADGGITEAQEAAKHPGPMYPHVNFNFERPYIMLGAPIHADMSGISITAADLYNIPKQPAGDIFLLAIDLSGAAFNFDVPAGSWLDTTDKMDPTLVTNPVLRGQRTLYDMLTSGGKSNTGSKSEVYVVLWGDGTARNNNGAFKVVGVGGLPNGYTAWDATTLAASAVPAIPALSQPGTIIVRPLSTDFDFATGFDNTTGNTIHVEFRSQWTNAEDGPTGAGGVADTCIVLTGIEDTAPWDAATLSFGDKDYSVQLDSTATYYGIAAKLKLDMTLLYHPGRGGTARIPDSIARFSGVAQDSTYLRQASGTLDPTFTAGPLNETFYDPATIQLWNRIGTNGFNAPDPGGISYGGVVARIEQDREHELFSDVGSKTLLFRPYRKREMTLKCIPADLTTDGGVNTTTLMGLETYPVALGLPLGTLKDSLSLFTTNARMGYQVPPEFMPRFGRQDIPFYRDILAGAGPYLDGINHLFCDTTTAVGDFVFHIIGGEDNAGNPGVKPIFFSTVNTVAPYLYGMSAVQIGPVLNKPNYCARKKGQINPLIANAATVLARFNAVRSDDLGEGLDGIQLPPYLGIARLYGVYNYNEYIALGGVTYAANRVTKEPNPVTNLLKRDADQQTLFILEDGAQDLVADTGAHTYIIPSNAIDINKIPALYRSSPHQFSTYHYVVECEVFGFSHDWINGNNYVIARGHTGDGTAVVDLVVPATMDVSPSTELEGVNMIVPCPASAGGRYYTAFDRTVYQGDPYMSRDGVNKNRVTSDYPIRYGEVPWGDGAFYLQTPVQQYSAAGVFLPTIPNVRSYEVLASLDFYTTMGTGNIGGIVHPGTCTDVGYTEDTALAATRIPVTTTIPELRVLSRTFSEGQRDNTTRAGLAVEFLQLSSTANIEGQTLRLNKPLGADAVFTFQSPSAYTVAADHVLAESDERVWYGTATLAVGVVDTEEELSLGTVTLEPNGVPLVDSDTITVTVDKDTPLPEGLVVSGRRDTGGAPNNEVEIFVTNTGIHYHQEALPLDFVVGDPLADGDSFTVVSPTNAAPWALPAGAVVVGDKVIINSLGLVAGVNVNAWVSAADTVSIRVTNASGAPVAVGAQTFDVEIRPLSYDMALFSAAPKTFYVRVSREVYSPYKTAMNFLAAVQAHVSLRTALMVRSGGGTTVELFARETGTSGNDWSAEITLRKTIPNDFGYYYDSAINLWPLGAQDTKVLATDLLGAESEVDPNSSRRSLGYRTKLNFSGGSDFVVNAGDGSAQPELVGMTERLPLGILLQDADFKCESPLNDNVSAFGVFAPTCKPNQVPLPLTNGREAYTRFLGAPGELIAQADGAPLTYIAYDEVTAPTGVRCFRTFRGGGGCFLLSGDNPGGPLEWSNESFPAAMEPILKGGVLAGRAMLVRNFPETAFNTNDVTTQGDEIQMVILTYGVFGDGSTQSDGLTLKAQISPTGYGDGYAASDRYRLNGHPMFKSDTRNHKDPATVPLAVFVP